MPDGRSERHLPDHPDRAFSLMAVLSAIGRLSVKNYTVPVGPRSPSPGTSHADRLRTTRWRDWEIGRFVLASLVFFTLLCADPESVADPPSLDGEVLTPAREEAHELSPATTCDAPEGQEVGRLIPTWT